MNADSFIALLGELRDFFHRMGQETNQGEVLADFGGTAYRITKYRE